MGNRNSKLSWSWPLISYNWLPGILGTINRAIEPSWEGLKRELIVNVANKGTGNNLFSQTKRLLLEFELVKENRRFISGVIDPTEKQVRKHLRIIFSSDNQGWVSLFHELSNNNIQTIKFDDIFNDPPTYWPDVAKYPVFKQWSELLQFVGLGVLVDSKEFILGSTITVEMAKDHSLMQKALKSLHDLRHITGRFSLHTEADFLSWTNGEDGLPISYDKKLCPRVPVEKITAYYRTKKKSYGWVSSLRHGIKLWDSEIETQITKHVNFDLNWLIINTKILLDFFILGNEQFHLCDEIKEGVTCSKEKWETIPNFKIPGTVWRTLPSLYKDINRLFFGVTHFRNSLRRYVNYHGRIQPKLYKLSSKELEKVKKIPIRGMRSKRSLFSILQVVNYIITSLERVEQNRDYKYFMDLVSKKQTVYRSLLPDNHMERRDLLHELEALISLSEKEKKSLLTHEVPSLLCSYNASTIQLCYWIHKYKDLQKLSSGSTIDLVLEKLNNLERKRVAEIERYRSNVEIWNQSFLALSKQLENIKGNINENPKGSHRYS